MTIEEQLELKREVVQFYMDRISDSPSLQDLISHEVNSDLYRHLESKGLIPQGMRFSTFEQIIQNKMNWAIMNSRG